MKIKFKTVQLHNFLSYKDDAINLCDRGYCAVTGENRFKSDNAKSNGSGKSTIFSAICYALTGETLQGLKSGLKNLNVSENSAWVKLDFTLNNDDYSLTRYVAPRTLLTIIKNGQDISGKGIKESESILAEHIPELSKDTISGIILLGQGLPNKFSNFSPSGRKDYLERLAKADFMLEDIKSRIAGRLQEVSANLRFVEDNLIAEQTRRKMTAENLTQAEQKLSELNKVNLTDLQNSLATMQNQIEEIDDRLLVSNKAFNLAEASLKTIMLELLTLSNQKAGESNKELTSYMQKVNELKEQKQKLLFESKSLQKEISEKKAIKDICPTCGQKLPNVVKPDTSVQEAKVVQINAEIAQVEADETVAKNKHVGYIQEIEKAFEAQTAELKQNEKQLNEAKVNSQANINSLQKNKQGLLNNVAKLNYELANQQTATEELTKNINSYKTALKTSDKVIEDLVNKKLEISARLDIVKKIESLMRRDFRGRLLANVIDFLDKKAKEYSKIVFGNENVSILLDGNSLSIFYDNKPLENLSGGEQTRVDLIVQLAIRAMLKTHLNFDSNIIALDECTDFLDQQSCAAVMNLLNSELNDTESVFIISHHVNELNLNIDTELHIVKGPDGNSYIL